MSGSRQSGNIQESDGNIRLVNFRSIGGYLRHVRYLVFKPDGIGDFILATGCISFLAREIGEENLTICVRDLLAPLAAAQFPEATVIGMPVAEKRKTVNLFALNFIKCLPVWRQLREKPLDGAASLRHMRNYLQNFLFFSAKTDRFVACKNLLADNGRFSRVFVEHLVRTLRKVEEISYPEAKANLPTELEANRRVISQLVGREVPLETVLPALKSGALGDNGPWVCCPLSSMKSKDYPFASWREIFKELREEKGERELLLVGSGSQRKKLEELRAQLDDIPNVRVEIPPTLPAFVDRIAAARVVLTVDTAACHIAGALDKRCAVLFSGLHVGMFGPWQKTARQRWLQPELQPGKTKWHSGITPMRAATVVRDLLREAS